MDDEPKSQTDKFREAARARGCDDYEQPKERAGELVKQTPAEKRE